MSFLTDLRFGGRMLAKTPSATLTVLLALSLGVGLSTVTFTLIDGAVLTHLPGEGGERVVRIGRGGAVPATARDYEAWVARQRSFDGIGAVAMSTVTLAVEGWGAEPMESSALTPSLLPLLSTEPVLGRMFTEGDAAPGAPAVALLSYEVWRDKLGSDPGALGSVVRVNGRPAEVVGVMPEGFGFLWNSQVWRPLAIDALRDVEARGGEDRMYVGRLREGVTLGTASDELTAISRELDAERLGAMGQEATVAVRHLTDLFGRPGQAERMAALVLGIAFLVLLVACANVANVLLARAIDRAREVAIRMAMGASRGRIVSQLLVEIWLLALAGAGGGVAIALVGTGWVEKLFPPDMPYWIHLRVNGAALAFVAVVAVVTALAAGLAPALRASRTDPHELLQDSSRGSSGRRGGKLMGRLVGTEMALSFVLLALAGLFIRSAANLRNAHFPFAPEQVSMSNVNVPDAAFGSPAELVQLTGEMMEAIGALPQVTGVALASAPPGIGSSPSVGLEIDAPSEATDGPRARRIVVTPGYFALLHGAPLTGRDFDARDDETAERVAIVNRPFVEAHFPDGRALDRRIRLTRGSEAGEWLTVVGAVPDLLAGGIEEEMPEAVYVPFAQSPSPGPTLLTRTSGDVAALGAAIRETVAALEPDVAIFRTWSLGDALAAANSGAHWMSLVFLISGAIALFLAAIGLYGVMAFWVIQRTREIGVRLAVGGQRLDIVRLVLGQALRYTGIGLGVGALVALTLGRVFAAALYDMAWWDPLVLGGTVGVLLTVALVGCLVPARRATGLDPGRALSAE